jgi:hypothetical protein
VAALAAAPLAAAAGSAAAQGKKPGKQVRQPDTTQVSARALTDIVRARHGKYLTAEQLQAARRRIVGALRSGENLHRIKLTNGDEPAFVFRADLP